MWLSKLLIFSVLSLLALVDLGQAERARFDNYRVYKASAKNEAQLAVLKQLEGSSDSIMFLNGAHIMNDEISIVVAPHKLPDFLELLDIAEISYTLEVKDFQQQLDKTKELVASKGRSDNYNWENYYELEDTYSWMQQLAREYPSVATLIEGGKSYEKRSILGVKISKSLSEKPGIFIEAGIHAREWIAPAAATYIINQLLTSKEESIQELANNYNWYIIPHANPDGYVYTHTTNRMWRKTRTPYGSCFGADPNRNWDFHWNEIGASSEECSDNYAGPTAFSEVETLSLARYIASIANKIQLYISFHSYSQYLLYPYGHTSDLPDNADHYEQVFDAAVGAINKRYGTEYTGGNIYNAIYPAAGTSVDWAFGPQNISMAFCYELRPSSQGTNTGFQLEAKEIIPASEELLDSITAMVAKVKELGYFH